MASKSGAAESGRSRVEWASTRMPVMGLITEQFSKTKPLDGVRIGGCLHLTTETAVLALSLKDAGADVRLCASNPLSTQDDVVAYLRSRGISALGFKGESVKDYYAHIESVVASKPLLTIDDGGDLTNAVMAKNDGVIGGTEETTTGVLRLRALERADQLKYPVIAVNEADTKHMFDNRYGTGQSTIDGILRSTNVMIAGKNFVVAGYGWVGRGIASRAKGMGAKVIVTEVDPVKALEAHMDGFEVMSMGQAAGVGDIFVTATGDINVINEQHMRRMKDLAIMANSGHFNVEIAIAALERMAKSKRTVREQLDEYVLPSGRRLLLLAQGRLVNLSAAEGHPSEVMDMSFANQALSLLYLARNARKLERRVYDVPREIDQRIAKLKLASVGIRIDSMTEEQRRYVSGYESGT